MANKTYTKKFYEVHTSQDGEKWYAHGTKHEENKTGLRAAGKAANEAARLSPFVRVAHIERTVTVLQTIENTGVLTRQQIDGLLTAGKSALAGVPGVSVNEGFMLGFGSSGISHSPTRVSVSLAPWDVLGKKPSKKQNEAAYLDYEQKSKEWCAATVKLCVEKLSAANIKLTVKGNEIVLRVK